MDGPLIRLQKLEKSFKTPAGSMFVLRKLDLEVAQGEFLAITGPSGAGKSTLLSILGLLDTQFDGHYWLADEAVHALDDRRRNEIARREIGFIFQRYHLLEDLTVEENLALPLEYRDVPRREAAERVQEMLARFELEERRKFFPQQLSGGQQQIVAVARAVITRPSLILADEPTGALHSSQGDEVLELLSQLNEDGITIVMVTHSEENADRAHRRIALFDGWLESAA